VRSIWWKESHATTQQISYEVLYGQKDIALRIAVVAAHDNFSLMNWSLNEVNNIKSSFQYLLQD